MPVFIEPDKKFQFWNNQAQYLALNENGLNRTKRTLKVMMGSMRSVLISKGTGTKKSNLPEFYK